MQFDYIIVGAGSAGSVLAARLSEDPAIQVLLLEAGPDYRTADRPRAMTCPNPGGIIRLPEFADFRYDRLLARRSTAQAPRLYWRGRGLGGSSTINGQIAIRCLPEDLDGWAEQGCTGWSWAETLPAHCRFEDDLEFGDRPYHGRGGPIPVYRAPLERWGPVDRALRAVALDLGYGWCPDHNAPEGTGVSPYAVNSRDGQRVSVSDAYLDPVRDQRANLTIMCGALVDRVTFDGTRATGVRARVGGEWRELAGGEIVVAGGAIHSPAILMRSGVGPADHLRSLGIDVTLDQPAVGANLVDHSAFGLWLDLRPEARVATHEHRHTNCCVRYTSGLAGAGRNEMTTTPMNPTGFSEEACAIGRLGFWTLQTFSRGRLRLTSADPEADPEVDINMLADERDLIRLREAARRAYAIAGHPAVTEIADRSFGALTRQPLTESLLENEAWLDAWLMAEADDTQHPVGTCRMGAPSDPRTVVDPDCRVVGLRSLRVIDASIMPDVPRANIHFTVLMAAEHMAARLRG